MKKFLCLLPLTPIIALAQELPDENWMCISNGGSQSSLTTPNTSVTTGKGSFFSAGQSWNFNPTKGFKLSASREFSEESCRVRGGYFSCTEDWPDGSQIDVFLFDSTSKRFVVTSSRILSLINSTTIYSWLGFCSKI